MARGDHRLIYIPFDDKVLFETAPPETILENGMEPSGDKERMESMLDELIDYISTKIRPVSIRTGNQHVWDGVLKTKGSGLC